MFLGMGGVGSTAPGVLEGHTADFGVESCRVNEIDGGVVHWDRRIACSQAMCVEGTLFQAAYC